MPAEQRFCSICGLPKTEGITILNSFICEECEGKIVAAEVGGKQYGEYLQKLKEVWDPLFLPE